VLDSRGGETASGAYRARADPYRVGRAGAPGEFGCRSDTHINEITNLIRTERLNDVVLCGHSYGGMVVTGVADRIRPQIASLVYLDSFVPHDGDSVLSLTGWPIPDGPTVAPPPASSLGLRGEDAVWVDGLITPHPSGCITQPIALQRAPAEGVPATYVLATDRASRIPHLLHAYERAGVTSGWTARTINGSHKLMIDSPGEVTTELLCASGRRNTPRLPSLTRCQPPPRSPASGVGRGRTRPAGRAARAAVARRS
jgi:pimeloyl-ACP methyl ester carboxylesterase